LNVTITTYVLLTPALVVNVFTINHLTNVMTTMHAPLITVAHLLVASTPILTAMITTNVPMTLAILVVDVKTVQ